MDSEATSHHASVGGIRLHYLQAGKGDPVLLLHGWPTSSFLWRNVMGAIARGNRVIALDLPGFGKSDKPLDASYSFRYYARTLDAFLDAIDVETTGLAVHDLGGPIGVYWACEHPERVSKLALLNTLVYPEASWAVIAFVVACRTPGLNALISSPWGLKLAMRIGIHDPTRVTDEMVRGVQAPFASDAARRALLKAGYGLHPKGFKMIAERLPSLQMPVRIIYGEHDRILPDVAETMRRVATDLPHAEVTVLQDCGHFLQEDRPDVLGELLARFFAS
jgi:pimeloyl-ACP methyl ester carboxylesterase